MEAEGSNVGGVRLEGGPVLQQASKAIVRSCISHVESVCHGMVLTVQKAENVPTGCKRERKRLSARIRHLLTLLPIETRLTPILLLST